MAKSKAHKEVSAKLGHHTPILLDCPICHSFISEKDLLEDKKRAKCGHCDHVFSFEEDGYWDPFGLPTETQPAGLELLRLPSFLEFKVSHRHSSKDIWPLIFFTLFWNIFIIAFVIGLLASGDIAEIPVISVHFIAGLFLLWKVFAKLFNETTIHIDKDQIRIETTPFKIWKRVVTIETDLVEKLYVKTNKRMSKGRVKIDHSLHARLKNGDKIDLMNDLDQKTLFYLEKEIERYLKIDQYAEQ